jgi:hypothetical protein
MLYCIPVVLSARGFGHGGHFLMQSKIQRGNTLMPFTSHVIGHGVVEGVLVEKKVHISQPISVRLNYVPDEHLGYFRVSDSFDELIRADRKNTISIDLSFHYFMTNFDMPTQERTKLIARFNLRTVTIQEFLAFEVSLLKDTAAWHKWKQHLANIKILAGDPKCPFYSDHKSHDTLTLLARFFQTVSLPHGEYAHLCAPIS